LNIPTSQPWPLFDYHFDGTTTRTYSPSKEIVSSVPVTTYDVDEDGVPVESESLAVASDGAIYTLRSFDDSLGIDGTWQTPVMVIPADIAAPFTWNFSIGGIAATGTLTPNIDSPAGYLGTYRIEYDYPSVPYQWTIHFGFDQFGVGLGILEEYSLPSVGTSAYERSDISPPQF
jgi:hypothetical protein